MKFKILDTTLRDGSYVNNFNIDQIQTFDICRKLDEIGFGFIEVGHGLGLNATNFKNMKGCCSDKQWMLSASKAVKNNKWGMFFIPGIGRKEDIITAAEMGMDFIRIGANANKYEKALPYIELAKKHKLMVHSNFMKSYAIKPKDLAKIGKISENSGSDVNCIVDSAGCMLPEEVKEYVGELKSRTSIKVGFHGHNNLGLAISNSIEAINNDADIIDTSIRGLGRSAGNTISEIFLSVLSRLGHVHSFDILKVFDLAEEHIDCILKNYKQVDTLSVLSGLTKFHSSFTPIIQRFAKKYDIDTRILIIELCKINIIDADENDLITICKRLTTK